MIQRDQYLNYYQQTPIEAKQAFEYNSTNRINLCLTSLQPSKKSKTMMGFQEVAQKAIQSNQIRQFKDFQDFKDQVKDSYDEEDEPQEEDDYELDEIKSFQAHSSNTQHQNNLNDLDEILEVEMSAGYEDQNQYSSIYDNTSSTSCPQQAANQNQQPNEQNNYTNEFDEINMNLKEAQLECGAIDQLKNQQQFQNQNNNDRTLKTVTFQQNLTGSNNISKVDQAIVNLLLTKPQNDEEKPKIKSNKYREVVRDKEKHRQMKGQQCFRCTQYYQAMGINEGDTPDQSEMQSKFQTQR